MAKAKKEAEATEEQTVKVAEFDGKLDIEKAFEKALGKGAMVSASQFLTRPKQIIPVSPKLDIGLNGGIPEGSTVICSGQPKTGKTTTALSFASRCQRPEYGERDVYYFDVEGRLKDMNLNGIKGLNFDKFYVIRSTPEKLLSAEDFLNGAVHVLLTKRKSLVILDSSSALCASKEQINSVTGSTRNEGPKLLASFFRKVGTAINVTDNILWIMQHLIADTSGHGVGYREDGGQKVQYQADVKLRVKFSEAWKLSSGEGAPQIGQKINWKIVTSALGGLPNQDAETFIRYGVGIDDVKEYMDLAISLAVIVQSGAWYKFEDINVQGGEKMYQELVNNADMFGRVKAAVDAMVKE